MQIRNNYDKEVFNGDIGVISSIDFENRRLTVIFDNRAVEYDVTELDELVQAYAITIHKSQGSEYPVVVMPVMLQKWLLAVPDVELKNWKAADFYNDEKLDVFDLCLMKREILLC